ncbi:uncharacterized protein BDR25DRAFT_370455 [Lindgomyces ingoldianus]|uniref:Uncharacterized protein n=1 Tax=Lindgomyces ingoldianus TaxID=673940 RepID=A0ACB6QUF1_9PLEO|nr:uncharacterized protein BDR25DRAFT_370455 [Lindgomyces ingoldianus]KAF2469806.1 hypothetical protein BDR25DRAFT_370455 [Lindgomyces ingoldianus]
MSGLKELAKGGWHPKSKGSGKESWRGDFKGVNTVAGWVGKGKNPEEEAHRHQSAPLSTLKDPASFGPPPKHINYHGAAASPNSTMSDRQELGEPLSQEETAAKQRVQEAREAKAKIEEVANKPTPGPYRANTTGLNTTHVPKPPTRRLSPPPTVDLTVKLKPKLPPRLPPRQNSHPDGYTQAPPPPYSESTQGDSSTPGHLNQGPLERLGQAGISVPGFNIGRTASPPVPPRQNSSPLHAPPSPAANANRGPQLSELQSRFAKLSTSSSQGQAPTTGTSLADKQTAFKTARNLRNDPSKVSLSDMKSAATTASNFRERHGEQATAGWRTASSLNQKYGIADRMNSPTTTNAPPSTPPLPQSPTRWGKKPPPPPPPKKRELVPNSSEPPPVPLGSKPKF